MNGSTARWLCGLLVAACLQGGLRAAAQTTRPIRPLGGEAPTAGVRLHAPALVGRADAATAIEVNPAALGLLSSWNVLFHHSELRGDSRVQGRGDGLFLGTPFPFYPNLAFGAGLQWLRPSDALGYADSAKLSFATSWYPTPWFGLGLAFHSFIADKDPALDDLESFDMGLVVRFVEWLGIGFAARNLNTPVYDGLPLQRIYDAELAVRPLRTERLELGVGFAASERRGDIDPHFRLVAEPLDGVGLSAHVELVPRDFYRDQSSETDVRATVGLILSLERLRLSASTLVGRSFSSGPGALGVHEGARSPFQGANVSLSLSGARQRSLVSRKKVLQLSLSKASTQRAWAAIDNTLRRAARRPDVTGVLLRVDDWSPGWAMAQELRTWIRTLQQRGKKVYVYLEAPSEHEYYAVAGADRLFISPGGGIRLQGLAVEQLFLRGLFRKIGVQPQFIRIAEYKSAPETLTRERPSAPAREMTVALVGDLFSQLVHGLARDRRQRPDGIRRAIDTGLFTPEGAREAQLVDRVVNAEMLREIVSRDLRGELVDAAALAPPADRWPVGPAVAVVLIEGDIVHGKSQEVPLIDRRLVGDETLVETLEDLRADARVRAVVLRINSPGGSALASERIWQAVRRTAERKPVIASLANVAASGGYFAAAAADQIFASPATLTGSIGIFTGKFNFSGLLAKLGVGVHATERGEHATLDSPLRPYTNEEEALILARLQYYYRSFLQAVGKGRHMTQNAVHAVARGRVWTGSQARPRKLVDQFGGLQDAIAEAKRRAGLHPEREVELLLLPRPKTGLLRRLVGLAARDQRGAREIFELLPAALREQVRQVPPLAWYARSGEPLALLPYLPY